MAHFLGGADGGLWLEVWTAALAIVTAVIFTRF